MGTIRGREYSSFRTNEDGEREYFIDDEGQWKTIEEIKEDNDEFDSWNRQAQEWEEDEDGTGWTDS